MAWAWSAAGQQPPERLAHVSALQTLGAGEAAASPCPLPCSAGRAAAALPSRGGEAQRLMLVLFLSLQLRE